MKTKTAFVFFLKYSPTIGALCYIVHYALLPFGIRTPMADYIIDLSFLAFLFLMIASKMFGFCKLHRAFIFYIWLGSIDVTLHHWGAFAHVPKLVIPVFMVAYGVTLFIMLAIKECKNESTGVCLPVERTC